MQEVTRMQEAAVYPNASVSLISPSIPLGFKLRIHNLKLNSNLILIDHKGETYFRLRLLST